MCGIVGAFSPKNSIQIDSFKIDSSLKALNKRGPTSNGFYHDPTKIFLGHTRLAIIDLTADGYQPMNDSSGRYTLIFNGEIFNYKELRRDLKNKGVIFKGNSDTEVLLYLLIHEKEKAFTLLNGFWALAFYDHQENTLLIARDRYGIKPLYFHYTGNEIYFASELKSLTCLKSPFELNYESILFYLQLNYIPTPLSIFKDIYKLTPGNYLTISERGMDENTYYSLPNSINTTLTYQDAQFKLHQLLDDSVKLRMVSDVPLGAFLSGGIDSSVLVALASKYTNDLRTYSIGFTENSFFDETSFAQLVADKYKTKHTVFKLSEKELLENLPDVLNYIDEPFADSSALAVYILTKYTKQQVTVALSGDGADELFAGYNKYAAFYRIMNAGTLEKTIGLLKPVLDLLPSSRNNPLGNKIRQISKFANGMNLSPIDLHWRYSSFISEMEAQNYFKHTNLSKIDRAMYSKVKNSFTSLLSPSPTVNDWLKADVRLVLTNDMLVKVDSMSMANSLEVRVPFLDYRIVDFAFSLPDSYKIDGKMKKKIVQDAFRDLLPSELYNRPKHGFEVPILKWLRGELKESIESIWLNEDYIKKQGIFDYQAVKNLKSQLFSHNPADSHATTWAMIVFQHWFENNKEIIKL